MPGLGEFLGSALGIGYNLIRDSSLTGAEREQNAWNAAQAEKQMSFQASQAEIARDWQENQYLKYNSPAALVRQYQDAGLNPALMFGGSTPSAPQTTSVPSGAMASGSFGAANRINAVDAVAKLGLLSAQIDNVKADTEGKRISNDWSPKMLEQQFRKGEVEISSLSTGIDRALAEIDNVVADTDNKKAQRDVINLQAVLLDVQAKVERLKGDQISSQTAEQIWRNEYAQKFGYYPDVTLGAAIIAVVDKLSGGILGNSVNSLENFLRGEAEGLFK